METKQSDVSGGFSKEERARFEAETKVAGRLAEERKRRQLAELKARRLEAQLVAMDAALIDEQPAIAQLRSALRLLRAYDHNGDGGSWVSGFRGKVREFLMSLPSPTVDHDSLCNDLGRCILLRGHRTPHTDVKRKPWPLAPAEKRPVEPSVGDALFLSHIHLTSK